MLHNMFLSAFNFILLLFNEKTYRKYPDILTPVSFLQVEK